MSLRLFIAEKTLCGSGLTDGQIYLKQGPAFQGIFLDNSALMFSHDLVADVESQAVSLTYRLGGKKRLENIFLNGRIDTGTAVLTGENDLIDISSIAC